jgi:hypothetical protein
MEEKLNAYKASGKPEGMTVLGTRGNSCEDNIKIDQKYEWKFVGWIHVVYDGD